jgi:hypothetical protein
MAMKREHCYWPILLQHIVARRRETPNLAVKSVVSVLWAVAKFTNPCHAFVFVFQDALT